MSAASRSRPPARATGRTLRSRYGGPGSGAVAVANTSIGTAASSYQPTYGAAPGWDMATGLGTPNAYNLVNSSAWLASTATTVSSNNNPSTSGQSVTFTANITGTYSSYSKSYPTGTVTWSSNTGCGSTTVTQGNPSTATCTTTSLPVGTDTITATYNADKANATSTGTLSGGQVVNSSTLSQTITVTTAPPSSAAYNSTFGVAATASSGLAVAITTSGSCSGSGSGSAAITMTSSTGTCSVIFNQAGGTNGSNTYSAAPTVTDTVNATTATSTTSVSSSLNPSTYGQSVSFTATVTSGATGTVQFNVDGSAFGSPVTLLGRFGDFGQHLDADGGNAHGHGGVLGRHELLGQHGHAERRPGSQHGGRGHHHVGSSLSPSTYGQSVTFTATIPGQYGLVKGRKPGQNGIRPEIVTGTVTWSANTGCGTTTVTSGTPGTATCTTTSSAGGEPTRSQRRTRAIATTAAARAR